MVKAKVEQAEQTVPGPDEQLALDSKYRMIIVAAQRSKQLQCGARPRAALDLQNHKPTRVALEEVQRGKVTFAFIEPECALKKS